MTPPANPFGFIPLWAAVYFAALVAFSLATFLLYHRFIRLIRIGKPAERSGRWGLRLWGLVPVVLGQGRVLQSVSLRWRDLAGVGHTIIFGGFLLFSLSYLIFIFGDSLWPPFSRALLTETGVRVYAFIMDIVATAILAVILWALVRRWIVRPHRLSFDLTRKPDTMVILAFIGGLMLFSLMAEAALQMAEGPWGAPVSGALASWLGGLGVSPSAATLYHGLFWWLHYFTILGFAVYIPFSKHMHLVASPVNVFFRRLEPMGTLPPIKDLETAESFGAARLESFTWKELLDGYACAVCGRCSDACPANLSGKVLSPMHVVESIKECLLRDGPGVARGEASEPVTGHEVPEQAVWDCLTCGACMAECPVTVEHVNSIVDMRRYLVLEEARMPEQTQMTLTNIERRGHPWRGTQLTRETWTQGLNIKKASPDDPGEVLYWVGCTGALEERSTKVVIALAQVLQRGGVDFRILGNGEMCCGDPARRMGNEYLYQTLVQQNIEALRGYGVTKIVTHCPHCYNTLKNEYPQFGGRFEVTHHTQFLAQLLETGRLRLSKALDTEIAYHDSCYLGRHNSIYREPRRILDFIPQVELVEFPRSGRRSFCCGAGGGHLWMEESGGTRINQMRVEEAMKTQAKVIATACVYCLQMMEDGIKGKNVEGTMEVADVAELLQRAM
ncbi:MAG: 4Fe-4S dicluster domain-containing protein [Chloroflexi bacterium]|nr:4Fe-4S dicluster domain-containing protein [Chloroflexota bacterium]